MRTKSRRASSTLWSMTVLAALPQACMSAHAQQPEQTQPQTQVAPSSRIWVENQTEQRVGFLLGDKTKQVNPGERTSIECNNGSSYPIEIRTGQHTPFSVPLFCGRTYDIDVSQGLYVARPASGNAVNQNVANAPQQQSPRLEVEQRPQQPSIQQNWGSPTGSAGAGASNPASRYTPNIQELIRRGL